MNYCACTLQTFYANFCSLRMQTTRHLWYSHTENSLLESRYLVMFCYVMCGVQLYNVVDDFWSDAWCLYDAMFDVGWCWRRRWLCGPRCRPQTAVPHQVHESGPDLGWVNTAVTSLATTQGHRSCYHQAVTIILWKLLLEMKIYRALTRALCPKNLQLNVSLQFLLDIKYIFINLLALQEQTNYNI